VLTLRSEAVLARVDPAHGAEILDVVELRGGRQLLGRPPFGSESPRGGDLDEEPWTAAWRGGWQGCLPNAGSACTVDGVRHGFHGRASNDPWQVLESNEASVVVSWEGHGVEAVRRLEATRDEMSVATTLLASDDNVPVAALEHLSLGLELIEPVVELSLPAGRASELDERLGPPVPPADAAQWPEITLVDGERERGERWGLEQERGRVYVVSDVAEGRAVVRNPARGHGVEIGWSSETLPHLIVWHEARGSGGAWRHASEILCIEPCSVPHLMGLKTALEQGQAPRLARGESLSWTMTLRPV
jgi:hypothetical protein